MTTCDCCSYPDVELRRDHISRRIRETRSLKKRLTLVHDTRDEYRLYSCPVCRQLWQWSRASNWGYEPYLFRVPATSLENWLREPYQSPDEMLIYDAIMSRYFEENTFPAGKSACMDPECSEPAVVGLGRCVRHHVEMLRRSKLLPREPVGRLFPPYSIQGATYDEILAGEARIAQGEDAAVVWAEVEAQVAQRPRPERERG